MPTYVIPHPSIPERRQACYMRNYSRERAAKKKQEQQADAA
jgi:hypothetical protein